MSLKIKSVEIVPNPVYVNGSYKVSVEVESTWNIFKFPLILKDLIFKKNT